jgi:hypothetical protein
MNSLPFVVSEDQISRFFYWQDGIQEGMRYKNELYTLVGRYSADDRLAAYDKSAELIDQGKELCMTTARGMEYSLWQALRTADRPPPDAP